MKKIVTFIFVLTLTLTACTKIATTQTPNSKNKPAPIASEKNTPEVNTVVNNNVPKEMEEKVVGFVNDYLVQGAKATLKEITEESGLYKAVFDYQGQEIASYLSMDGKNFFPQMMVIDDVIKEAEEKKIAEAEANMPVKQDKASVELFVMSHCPFGTQIEKGMIPVIETLGDKVDFTLKFCDYAMHAEKEITEQVKQYCIQKNEPEKLIGYLKCFLADENLSDQCIDEQGINKTNMEACVAETNTTYNVIENMNDKSRQFPAFDVYKEDNTKYGVQGSPTLVINGKTNSAGRDSASLLKAICDSYNVAPEECATELSPASPSPGFGFNESDQAATAATCG